MDVLNSITSQFSEQIYVLLGIVCVLSIIFVLLGRYIRKQDPIQRPKRLMLVLEMYYDFITKVVDSIFFGRAGIMMPYAAMLLIFILTMNWTGLFIPFHPPTTDYNVPLGLVIISFSFRYVYDLRYNGLKHHIKSYVSPYPFMLPIHLLDIFAKPLSMSMRLFGNILSGTLVLTVFYSAMGALQMMVFDGIPTTADGGVTLNIFGAITAPALHFYFDIFAGTIQAFVFTLLTLIFTSVELDFDKIDREEKMKQVPKEKGA